MSGPTTAAFLIVAATSEIRVAIELHGVDEVTCPLPFESLRGAPPGVVGVVRLRGRPTPVLSLAELLGGEGNQSAVARYFVVIDTELHRPDRRVALAVPNVIGVRQLPLGVLGSPLLDGGGCSRFEVVERALVGVLERARVLDTAQWVELEAAMGGLGS